MSRATSARNAVASAVATGPGAAGSATPSTCAIGCTSRVVDDRNASSALASASIDTSASLQSSASSRSSPRVTPRRHPADWGRRDERAVAHDEHVRTRRLTQVPARVREDRLARTPFLGVGEGAHVGGVRDRLQPGGRTVLVARPRRHHDVDRRCRRFDRCRDKHHDGPPAGTTRRSRRRGAAGDGEPKACVAQSVRVDDGDGGGAQRRDVGDLEAEPRRRCREPLEVPAPHANGTPS